MSCLQFYVFIMSSWVLEYLYNHIYIISTLFETFSSGAENTKLLRNFIFTLHDFLLVPVLWEVLPCHYVVFDAKGPLPISQPFPFSLIFHLHPSPTFLAFPWRVRHWKKLGRGWPGAHPPPPPLPGSAEQTASPCPLLGTVQLSNLC